MYYTVKYYSFATKLLYCSALRQKQDVSVFVGHMVGGEKKNNAPRRVPPKSKIAAREPNEY